MDAIRYFKASTDLFWIQADSMEADALSAQLACGLCSLAEMYMQSEKGIEEVAPQCEDLLQQAQQADKRSPEPLQVMIRQNLWTIL